MLDDDNSPISDIVISPNAMPLETYQNDFIFHGACFELKSSAPDALFIYRQFSATHPLSFIEPWAIWASGLAVIMSGLGFFADAAKYSSPDDIPLRSDLGPWRLLSPLVLISRDDVSGRLFFIWFCGSLFRGYISDSAAHFRRYDWCAICFSASISLLIESARARRIFFDKSHFDMLLIISFLRAYDVISLYRLIPLAFDASFLSLFEFTDYFSPFFSLSTFIRNALARERHDYFEMTI